jgi:hypothetical protein
VTQFANRIGSSSVILEMSQIRVKGNGHSLTGKKLTALEKRALTWILAKQHHLLQRHCQGRQQKDSRAST